MERRTFLQFLSAKLLTLGGLFLAACGRPVEQGPDRTALSDDQLLSGASCSVGAAVVQTDSVHPHQGVALSASVVAAANPGTYTLLTGSHDHTFILSAADFQALQDGQQVTKPLDMQGHGHTITITC